MVRTAKTLRTALVQTVKQNKKLFVRFLVSFVITCILLTILGVTAAALSSENGSDAETRILAENPDAEPVDDSVLKQLVGIDGSQTLEVILLITILSVAPSILVMVTSFTRIIIVFSFLRNAMQTQSIPPNTVLTGLALFLTVFIMWPVFTDINDNAYQPYSEGEITINEMLDRSADSLKEFMLRNTSKKNMQFFLDIKGTFVYDDPRTPEEQLETAELEIPAETTTTADIPGVVTAAAGTYRAQPVTVPMETMPPEETAETTTTQTIIDPDFIPPIEPIETFPTEEQVPVDLEETEKSLTEYMDQLGLETVIPAFILSELTRAFQMGFMLFIPFLVIDIVVSSTLMAMGMMMLPPSMISLPFKIMLFVLVDGWQLLIGTVINSFNL